MMNQVHHGLSSIIKDVAQAKHAMQTIVPRSKRISLISVLLYI